MSVSLTPQFEYEQKNDCHFKPNVIIYSTNVKLHQISSWNYNENLTGSSTAIVNGCQIKSACYWSQNDFPSLKLYINQIIALCSNLFIQNGEKKSRSDWICKVWWTMTSLWVEK